MSKEIKKGGRKASEIDTDFLHGVTREHYLRSVIRGGSERNRILERMGNDKIERYAMIHKPSVRDLLDILIERGVIKPENLKALKADKERFNTEEALERAGIPATWDELRVIVEEKYGKVTPVKVKVPVAETKSSEPVRERTRVRERERSK